MNDAYMEDYEDYNKPKFISYETYESEINKLNEEIEKLQKQVEEKEEQLSEFMIAFREFKNEVIKYEKNQCNRKNKEHI